MSEQSDSNLSHGVRLARAGKKKLAAAYLAAEVQRQPSNEAAWLWLAACLDDPDRQRYCLRKAVKINPGNHRARQALEQLSGPGRNAPGLAEHIEITQPVRAVASVPYTGGVMMFEAPADLGRDRSPLPDDSARPTWISRGVIAILGFGLLLLFFTLLYFLWATFAPNAAPGEIPALALRLLNPNTLAVREGDSLGQIIAAAPPNATIRLAAGVYHLEETLRLTRPIRITGAGMDETYIISAQSGPLVSIQGSGVFALQGLELRHEGPSAADVLVMDGGVLELSNCRIVGGVVDAALRTGGRGLALGGTSAGSVDTCEVLDNQGHGIEIGMLATVSVRYSTIHDNLGNGIAIHGAAQPRLEENIIANNHGAGLIYMDQAGGKVIHNEIRANQASGVEITGSAAPVLHENASVENQENGIRVADQARPILVSNRASANGRAGLAYFDRAAGAAEDNQCSDNGLHGISVNDSAEPFLMQNSCTHNRQVGIDYWGVSGGVARGNECAENGLQGIAVHENAAPVLEQNNCHGNQDSGIIFWDAATGQARENICSENRIHGISVRDEANPVLSGNRCENNGESGIQTQD